MTNARVTVAPADHYPIPTKPNGRRDSASICFIASSVAMIPNGPLGSFVDDPKKTKLSECGLDEDLEPIGDKSILFIRQIPQEIDKFINVPNKYQIETEKGERLFEIVEITDAVTRRLFQREQPFQLKIINTFGDFICEIKGDPGIAGQKAYVRLERDSKTLGRVVQSNPFLSFCNFSPSYDILNEKRRTISKLIWQRSKCIFTDDFQVYDAPKKKLVAAISRLTKVVASKDQNQTQADVYSLTFHDDQMDNLEKIYLIAAGILLDFQYFQGRESHRKWKVALCCLMILVIILIICVVGATIYFIFWD